MITEVTCYRLICDCCGHDNESGEGFIPFYDSEKEARYQAGYDGWVETDEGLFCPECLERHLPVEDDDA